MVLVLLAGALVTIMVDAAASALGLPQQIGVAVKAVSPVATILVAALVAILLGPLSTKLHPPERVPGPSAPERPTKPAVDPIPARVVPDTPWHFVGRPRQYDQIRNLLLAPGLRRKLVGRHRSSCRAHPARQELASLVDVEFGHLHTGVMHDGRVLVAGGDLGTGNRLVSAELYNPATGRFSPTGAMTAERVGLTATLLLDGRVLVVGANVTGTGIDILNGAELYLP